MTISDETRTKKRAVWKRRLGASYDPTGYANTIVKMEVELDELRQRATQLNFQEQSARDLGYQTDDPLGALLEAHERLVAAGEAALTFVHGAGFQTVPELVDAYKELRMDLLVTLAVAADNLEPENAVRVRHALMEAYGEIGRKYPEPK